jgi:phosphohistidine swiveling domain-containing protein
MLFCRNTAQRFLSSIGTEKKFFFSDGKISERTPLTLANAVFAAAKPFEIAANAGRLSIAALKVNSELDGFERHYKESLLFWAKNRGFYGLQAVSEEAMRGALLSMRYSFFSSVAFSLKIRLKKSFPVEKNAVKELVEKSRAKSREWLAENAGFFSLSPYDISKPFLEESPGLAEMLGNVPAPQQPHYIWRENAKLCCSMHLAILRKCFLRAGKESGLGNDIFFLKPSQLHLAISDPKKAKAICSAAKKEFAENAKIEIPNRIAIEGGKFFFEEKQPSAEINGIGVGSKGRAEGRLVFAESAADFGKVSAGDVIFSKSFSPELVVFYEKCAAVLSGAGGLLAHSAIVAREKGIPCVVQVRGWESLKEGSRVLVDGASGKITVL